jgi:hypothetical protein
MSGYTQRFLAYAWALKLVPYVAEITQPYSGHYISWLTGMQNKFDRAFPEFSFWSGDKFTRDHYGHDLFIGHTGKWQDAFDKWLLEEVGLSL